MSTALTGEAGKGDDEEMLGTQLWMCENGASDDLKLCSKHRAKFPLPLWGLYRKRARNGVRNRKRLAGLHAVTASEQPGGGRGGVSNLLLPLTSSSQPASSSVKATTCSC